jgi:hypothetical protein
VYAQVKGFACCEVLNLAGGLWLALLTAGSFGLVLCLLSFGIISALDSPSKPVG